MCINIPAIQISLMYDINRYMCVLKGVTAMLGS